MSKEKINDILQSTAHNYSTFSKFNFDKEVNRFDVFVNHSMILFVYAKILYVRVTQPRYVRVRTRLICAWPS